MQEVKINKHGNYLYGILEGVEPKDDNTWTNEQGKSIVTKSHLVLSFIMNTEVKKEIQGTEIITFVPRKQIIQLPVPSTDLIKLFKHYNGLVKKDLLINYTVMDNFKVKIDVDDIIDLSLKK